MPNPPVALRTCAGGHIVPDSKIVGMTTEKPGVVELYCTAHAELFDDRLITIGDVPLQM
jgi:hypothetical protein